MRSKIKTLWFVIFLLAFVAPSHADQLTFTTGDWRPYIFEKNGTVDPKMPGFSIEIVNRVFAQMGHQVKYETLPFLRQIKAVEKGQFVALAGVFKEEAPQLIFPREPIGISRNCFYTKRDSSWRYSNPPDLSKVVIAVVDGYIYGEIDSYIAADNDNVIALIGNEGDMMLRLSGLVDIDRAVAFVQDTAVADHYFREKGIGNRYKEAGCLPHFETMVGFSPNDSRTPAFVKSFDAGVAKLRQSGDLQRILDKYGVSDWK